MCPQPYIWGRPTVLHRAWSFARWRTAPRALGNPSLSRAGGNFTARRWGGLRRGAVGGWIWSTIALAGEGSTRTGRRRPVSRAGAGAMVGVRQQPPHARAPARLASNTAPAELVPRLITDAATIAAASVVVITWAGNPSATIAAGTPS
jgi:hypothetical protein